MLRIDDRLEIMVRQAPISKIVIYNDKIEIIRGVKNPKVDKTYNIYKSLQDKYLSFPRVLKEILDKEEDDRGYILDGYHVEERDFPVIPINEYDNFDDNEYYSTIHPEGLYHIEDYKLELMEKLNENELIIIFSETINNNYKNYIMRIFYLPSIDDMSRNIEGTNYTYQFITNPEPRRTLELVFVKDDCVYINNNKVVKNYSEDKTANWIRDFIDSGNKIIGADSKRGFFITKE